MAYFWQVKWPTFAFINLNENGINTMNRHSYIHCPTFNLYYIAREAGKELAFSALIFRFTDNVSMLYDNIWASTYILSPNVKVEALFKTICV